ncbi:triphosphoribosyl-dephospho-CoA synthase [Methylorubrum suomiense]
MADLYRAACLAELDALKPGNVHAYASGHRMVTADFVTSADVSAPARGAGCPGRRTGARRRGGDDRGRRPEHQSRHPAPLCAAARAAEAGGTLAEGLSTVLSEFDASDAADVFAAIRRANPGGLGKAARHDVTETASVPSLSEAMAEAAPRDRIARAYTDGFRDLFAIGLPALAMARGRGLVAPWTTTAVHLAYLTTVPDSHIARKHGAERAEAVRAEAATRLAGLDLAEQPVAALLDYDSALKADGLNPGTSADFTVATLFLDALLAARDERI